MRALTVTVAVVLAVVAIVHGRARNAPLSHHDRLLVCAANGGAEDVGFDALTERVAMAEARLVGARPGAYRWVGLVLLAAAAVALGAAVRRLARPTSAERTLPVDAGVLGAALFAAAPLHADSIPSLSGHVRLAALSLACVAAAALAQRPRAVLAAGALALVACIGGGATDDFAARAVTALRWTAFPAPAGLDDRSASTFVVSFAGVLGAAAAWGLLAGGAARLRLAVFLGFTAAAIGCAAFALPAPRVGIAGASAAMLPAAAAALLAGAALDAVARRGTGEVVALALVVFFVYSSVNAAGLHGPQHAEAVAPEEMERVIRELRDVDPRFERVVILGLPQATATSDPLEAVIAASSAPWRARPRTVVCGMDGAWDELPEKLLGGENRPTVVVEWRAPHPFARRPRDWKLIPLLGCRGTTGRVRLVSPAPGAELTTARPGRIEDDVTFEFEIDGALPLADGEVPVFFAFWEGGRNPRGRDRVTGRILDDGVLEKRTTASGATRFRWRTSIRPGAGEDGVYFDDPDMQLAGKPMLWTVGITLERGGDGHGGHGGNARTPHEVAQTRKAWFR